LPLVFAVKNRKVLADKQVVTCSPDHPQSATIQIPVSLGGDRRSVSCLVHGSRGKRLLIEATERVPTSVAVSVEMDDTMFLGEVIACSASETGWKVELKIEQILNGLQSLMALRSHLLDQPVGRPFGFLPAGVRN
jgi:hypothetical protein